MDRRAFLTGASAAAVVIALPTARVLRPIEIETAIVGALPTYSDYALLTPEQIMADIQAAIECLLRNPWPVPRLVFLPGTGLLNEKVAI